MKQKADTDGSGVIDYTEFLAATLDKKVYVQARCFAMSLSLSLCLSLSEDGCAAAHNVVSCKEDIVWTAFKKFDLDNNGSIDMKELAQAVPECKGGLSENACGALVVRLPLSTKHHKTTGRR